MTQRHRHLESLKIWSEECVRHARTCALYPTGQSLSSALGSVLNGYDARTEDQVPDGRLALPRAIENVQVAVVNIEKQIHSKHVDTLSDVVGSAALSNFVY
jgi:hypothetical protein